MEGEKETSSGAKGMGSSDIKKGKEGYQGTYTLKTEPEERISSY